MTSKFSFAPSQEGEVVLSGGNWAASSLKHIWPALDEVSILV